MLHLHDDSDEVSIMSYEKVKVVNGDGEFDEEDEEEEDDEDEVELCAMCAFTFGCFVCGNDCWFWFLACMI